MVTPVTDGRTTRGRTTRGRGAPSPAQCGRHLPGRGESTRPWRIDQAGGEFVHSLLAESCTAVGAAEGVDPRSMYAYGTYMPETLTGRLNFRLSAEQERALREAAALTGQSVSGFVLSSAVEHAQDVLQRANTITLSDRAYRAFVAALDEPAEEVPELVRLFSTTSQIPRT